MTNAVVLIHAEREALPELGGPLAGVEGVAEAYSVTGEWDFVAIHGASGRRGRAPRTYTSRHGGTSARDDGRRALVPGAVRGHPGA